MFLINEFLSGSFSTLCGGTWQGPPTSCRGGIFSILAKLVHVNHCLFMDGVRLYHFTFSPLWFRWFLNDWGGWGWGAAAVEGTLGRRERRGEGSCQEGGARCLRGALHVKRSHHGLVHRAGQVIQRQKEADICQGVVRLALLAILVWDGIRVAPRSLEFQRHEVECCRGCWEDRRAEVVGVDDGGLLVTLRFSVHGLGLTPAAIHVWGGGGGGAEGGGGDDQRPTLWGLPRDHGGKSAGAHACLLDTLKRIWQLAGEFPFLIEITVKWFGTRIWILGNSQKVWLSNSCLFG